MKSIDMTMLTAEYFRSEGRCGECAYFLNRRDKPEMGYCYFAIKYCYYAINEEVSPSWRACKKFKPYSDKTEATRNVDERI